MPKTAQLTQATLDQAFGELMKAAVPPMTCPQCRRPIFVFGLREGQTEPNDPCLDCLMDAQEAR